MMNAALLIVQLMGEDLQERVISIYKELLTKNVFMTFTGFEEVKEKYSNIARLVTEVIKSLSSDLHGFQLSDEEAEEIASNVWQILREIYQESE